MDGTKPLQMKRILLLLVIALIIVGTVGYFIVYKPHREISSEKPEFVVKVADIKKAFTTNDSIANLKYSDKTIAVSGTITAVDEASQTITIDGSLSAVLNSASAAGFTDDQQVSIKGRFVGYDDLLDELKMDQVTIYNATK